MPVQPHAGAFAITRTIAGAKQEGPIVALRSPGEEGGAGDAGDNKSVDKMRRGK